jgi:hypothetical protein
VALFERRGRIERLGDQEQTLCAMRVIRPEDTLPERRKGPEGGVPLDDRRRGFKAVASEDERSVPIRYSREKLRRSTLIVVRDSLR